MSVPITGPAVILASGTMLRGSADGNIDAGSLSYESSEGLYIADTRLLSHWTLKSPGRDLRVAGAVETATGRALALVPSSTRNETTDLFITRDQRVAAEGLYERLTLRNTGAGTLTIRLQIEASADFADQFALRTDGKKFDLSGARRSQSVDDEGALIFDYHHGKGDLSFHAGVRIQASIDPTIRSAGTNDADMATLEWAITVEPGLEQILEISALNGCMKPGRAAGCQQQDPGLRPSNSRTTLANKSLEDLDALCMPCPGMPEITIPAAGVPWFLTLFGRDSLITAMLTDAERPDLLPDVLRALAATQGTNRRTDRVEQPGKIVHEVRVSGLATLGLVPYARYYGTVDATPLFLGALGRLKDQALLREMETAARAAVAWLRTDGGLDANGFVTYTPDPFGLLNQGWKDSHDAIAAADGTHATGPVALCEVQGYAWRGLVETARLAREVWHDPDWAMELELAADSLQARFRSAFWMPEHDFPAVALDGQGRQVNALASNAGHLLWSGILNDRDALAVTERLLRPDFFTGWGIRTLAADQKLFHPLSYHNGSVWPHDTIIAAEGMASYGLTSQAQTAARGIVDAAQSFNNRLPELFGGFSRQDFPTPVSYGHAGTPQAWASAAAIAAERILAL